MENIKFIHLSDADGTVYVRIDLIARILPIHGNIGRSVIFLSDGSSVTVAETSSEVYKRIGIVMDSYD